MNPQLKILLGLLPFAVVLVALNLVATFWMYDAGVPAFVASIILAVVDVIAARRFADWWLSRCKL